MTGVGRSLATKVPRGHRAVSIAVSDVTSVNNLIRPNNYVDILAILKLGSSPGASDQKTIVATLFQNILVVAVGNDIGEVKPASGDGEGLGMFAAQESATFNTVTVALTPEQVQALVLVQEVGDITLSLRSFREGDDPVALERANPIGVLGIEDERLVKRRAPSWQEIRGSTR
jgi:pilus assembly protein CpaB